MGIYAVIKTGGKQYRVSPGDVVRVEKLPSAPGNAVEISDVFLLVNNGEVAVGNPTVANVRVIAEVMEQGRGEKIHVFKKRRRKHYQKSMGHRQYYSALRISEIIQGGQSYKADPAVAAAAGAPAAKSRSATAPGTTRPAPTPPSEAPRQAPRPVTTGKVAPAKPAVTSPPAPPPVVTAPVANPPPVTETRSAVGTSSPIPPVRDRAPIGTDDAATPAHPADERERRRAAATPPPETAVTRVQVDSVPAATPKPPAPEMRPTSTAPPVASDKDTRRRSGFYWPLAALLGLLLAAIGWLIWGGKHTATAPAAIEAAPTEDAVATEKPPSLPPIKEVKVRKPARAPAPSAPTQPPD